MSNHKMIGLLNHYFLVDIKNQLISEHILPLIGITAEDIPQLINPLPSMQYYANFVVPRDIYYFTLPQIYELFAKAPKRKFLDEILNVINTRVLPLFEATESNIKIDVLNKSETTVANMSSLEIAELTGKEHRNVIRDINKLVNELGDGVLKIEQGYYTLPNTGKQQHKMYNLNRESALLLTSGYSAQLRLKIIRRLDELESGKPALPQITPPIQEVKLIDRPQPTKVLNASFLKTATKQIENMPISEQSKQVLKAHLLHEQAGLPLDLMLPVVRDVKLSPAQIAERLKISSQAVGHIISKLGIRGNENYCEGRLSKAPNNGKDVVMYYYNNQAVNMIEQSFLEKNKDEK